MYDTREAWLNKMTDLLRPAFETADAPLPSNIRITCGFPSRGGRPGKKQVLGECWPATRSDDEHFEIFITPMRDNPVVVAGILVHELVHAAVGFECGHRGAFKSVALTLGLEGRMTETTVGEALTEKLQDYADQLGPYPHASLNMNEKPPQTTRMIKVVCPTCGYLVRTTHKWILLGTPTCCCGTLMEAEEAEEAEEDNE